MPMKHGNPGGQQVVIDLTMSDDDLEDTNSRYLPKLTLPDPSNPINPRRLTAAECLRADRIAHGELDLTSDSYTRDPPSQSLIRATDLATDSAVAIIEDLSDKTGWFPSFDEALTATRGYHFQVKDSERSDAAFHQGRGNEIPLQRGVSYVISSGRERTHASHSIRTSSEDEDSSDHESVLYQEEDSAHLRGSEKTLEVVETMTKGRPRRACAPRSFKGLMPESTFESEEIVNADKRRADLIERATTAHRELWENRLVDGFSYSCGRIDDGIVRHALMNIAQSFGAKCKVEKRTESGKKVKHVIMKWTRRLRSPSEMNIQESADRIMSRLPTFSDSRDPKDPLDSTRDSITKRAQYACTEKATAHHARATKRPLGPQERFERARAEDTRRTTFQQKRQRNLEGTKIGIANKGFSMLAKMGWTEGGRLGAKENGISEPIVAQFRMGRSGLGTR